jgi:hypothetical protein
MSFPPPSGLQSTLSPGTSSGPFPPPSSLPPRPPPSDGPIPSIRSAHSPQLQQNGFSGPPAFSGTAGSRAGAASAASGAFTGFRPRQLGRSGQDWKSHSPTVSAAPAPPTGFSAPHNSHAGPSFPSSSYQAPQPQQYYSSTPQEYTHASAPQIRNPFPLPGQGGIDGRGEDAVYDPELEAQIAQWQSAYAGKDEGRRTQFRTYNGESSGSASGANAGALGSRGDAIGPSLSSSAVASSANPDSGVAAIVSGKDGKQKTVIRSGGGQTWADSTLLEWDPAHFRLFVGNLAGEVTDESLLKAFSKYPSVQKARVIRDKSSSKSTDERSWKSKGFGFVSFSDGDEYFQAARDMQGKYIGSHPILLRRSTTEIRPVAPKDKKGGKHGKKSGRHRGNGDQTGGGVYKKSNKTKGGLRVLG